MQIHQVAQLSEPGDETAVIVTYAKKSDPSSAISSTNIHVDGLTQAENRGELRGSLYSTAIFRGSPTVIFVGTGNAAESDAYRYLRAVGAGARAATSAGFNKLAVVLDSTLDSSSAARAAVEGVIRATYDSALLKTGQKDEITELESLTLVGGQVADEVIREAQAVAEAANFARTLVNLPAGDLTPAGLGERLQEMATQVGIECRVLNKTQIEEVGMGALLAVAKGSAEEPRVIDLRYGDENASTKLAFVGKGLTFDAGGLSIKTGAGMEWMKADMGGAAAVAGAMMAIGRLKPQNIHVRGLIGATENMLGPAAMKPGDVLRTLKGKTIEVLNTDAEGRLVLADMLAYAVQGGATNIVDLATLTGAIVVALGNEAAGLIGKPDSWTAQVAEAADEAIERVWRLPLYPEYRQRIDSYLADMKNTSGSPGGALTASALLSEFVDDVPWAHLDIAGTAWHDTKLAFAPVGGTGWGVATLVRLASNLT